MRTGAARILTTLLAIGLCLCVSRPAAMAAERTGAAWLEGRWIGGEADGDDFDLLLDVQGQEATLHPRSATPEEAIDRVLRFRIDAAQAPTFMLRSPANEAAEAGTVVLQSRNQGIMWMAGAKKSFHKVLRLRRLGELPSEVVGTWQVERTAEPDHLLLQLTAEGAFRTDDKGKGTRLTIHPLSRVGSTIDLVLAQPGDEGRLCHLLPLPGNRWLFWLAEESDGVILERVGHRVIPVSPKESR